MFLGIPEGSIYFQMLSQLSPGLLDKTDASVNHILVSFYNLKSLGKREITAISSSYLGRCVPCVGIREKAKQALSFLLNSRKQEKDIRSF